MGNPATTARVQQATACRRPWRQPAHARPMDTGNRSRRKRREQRRKVKPGSADNHASRGPIRAKLGIEITRQGANAPALRPTACAPSACATDQRRTVAPSFFYISDTPRPNVRAMSLTAYIDKGYCILRGPVRFAHQPPAVGTPQTPFKRPSHGAARPRPSYRARGQHPRE